MKKIVSSSLVLGAMMSLVGCGGGSDTSASTGTAYYVDSAVSGVNYVCGTQEGITGSDGSFTFDVGSGCTFYLGDIMLREVAVGSLKDGAKIVEDDAKIGLILQNLDSDGNPDNGITISEEAVAVMQENGVAALPSTVEEAEALAATISSSTGNPVITQADAQTHLDSTMVKELISGKTFYIPGSEEDDSLHLTKVIVNADATHTAWSWVIGTNEAGEGDITIDGNMMYVADSNPMEYISQTTDYLIVKEHHSDGSTYEARWYTDRTKAEAFMNTLGDGGGASTDNGDISTVITTLSYMKTHPTDKLASTDCHAYIGGGETVSLVWVGNTLQTPIVEGENSWADVLSALRYDLAPADNMYKSIDGCKWVQTAVSSRQIASFEEAVSIQNRNLQVFSDSPGGDTTSTPSPNVDDIAQQQNDFEVYSDAIKANTVSSCKEKYGTYTLLELASIANTPTDADIAVGQSINGDAAYCQTLLIQSGDLSY